MAAIDLIHSSSAVDVVRILDDKNMPIFEDARVLRAGVNSENTIFEHPIEDGSKLTDYMIVNPTIIQLGVIIQPDNNPTGNLLDHKARGTTFIIQTLSGTYDNMVIQAMPHEEGTYGDCIAMSVTFQEVQWYTSKIERLPRRDVTASSKPTNKGAKPDASTEKRGQVQTKDTESSVLYGVVFQ